MVHTYKVLMITYMRKQGTLQ